MADAFDIDHPYGGKCSARAVDRVIAELAERQHGVVGRRQLIDAGVSRRQIDRRLERGSLYLVYRGVYAVGHKRLGLEGRWMAAVLACGPRAVLSHRTAARLWGLMPRSSAFPEVTRPESHRTRAGIVAHRAVIPDDEIRRVSGIPVTSVPRTQLDLAVVLSRSQMEKVMNEGEVQGLTDDLSIPDLLERYPRRPGTPLLRSLVADERTVRGVTRRELEARFKEVLARTDLPRPRLNADVSVRGRFFEADCLWGEQQVIVELDGRAAHGTRRAFERDRERDRLLQAEGWRVVRVTWRQLRDDAPAVIDDLRRMLRSGGRAPTL